MPNVTATLEARWIRGVAGRFSFSFQPHELPKVVAQIVSSHLANQGIRMTGDGIDAEPVAPFTYVRQPDGSWIITQEQPE